MRYLSIGTALAVVACAPASAAMLELTSFTTNNGITNVTTSTGLTNNFAPGPNGESFGYTHTYTESTPNQVVNPNTSNPTGYGFYDDFVFTVTSSVANSITTTIDLGTLSISNLQQRLYQYTGSVPDWNSPPAGMVQGWTSPIGTIGQVAVLSATNLAAGTYVLEIRGNVTGGGGGTYSGVLNLTPVPLPAAVWLFGSGLLALFPVLKRRILALLPA